MKQRRFEVQIIASPSRIADFEEFNKCAGFVGNLFTFNLPPVLIQHTRKLVVELLESNEPGYIYPQETSQTIYFIRKGFDFLEFENSTTSSEKIEMVALCAYNCLLTLYQHLNLNCIDVETAYLNIINKRFNLNVTLCGGAKLNKKKTTTASVTAQHYLDYALIQVTFFDVNEPGTVKKIDLYKTKTHPGYYIYTQLVSSAKWTNNEVFSIFNNTNEFILTINNDYSCTSSFNPKAREIDGIIEEVRFLTKEILFNQ